MLFSLCLSLPCIAMAATRGTVNSDNGLFVRSDNSTKSEKIGSLKDKDEVEIIDSTKNWYKISFITKDGKKVGYVLKKHIETKDSKKDKKDLVSSKDKKSDSKKKADKKAEEKKADKKSDKNKTEDKKTDDKRNEEKKTVNSSKKEYRSIIVGADLLNVRAKNSKKSPIIATVMAGETYPIKRETKNWVKIALTGTTDGYVMKEYVDFSVVEAANGHEVVDTAVNTKDDGLEATDNPATATEEIVEHASDMVFTDLTNKLAVSNVPAVNVRKDTNTKSPILSMLLKGGRLEATGMSDNWVRVSIDEDFGYIMKQYVDIEDGVLIGYVPEEEWHIATNDEEIVAPNAINGEAVVEYAKQFLGNPYVWGGRSLTNGADCSGFVQSIYKSFGYDLKRTSAQQRTEGISVASLSEALPGDLICYDGHIGIYMGAGKGLIHASNPRTGITITGNPSYRPILAIRRIINQ